jgi:transcriptional regulator with XRE-family HTH domain
MDSVKIGKYIAYKRKQKGMTQQELADILMITNKAISKWETGVGVPDISILKDLAKALNVTVDELLEGEDNQELSLKEEKQYQMFHIDKALYKQFVYYLYYQKRILVMIGIIFGSLLLTGGFAVYSMHRYIGNHMDILGFVLSGIGLIILLLPFIFIKIQCALFHDIDSRYVYDRYGILYTGNHEESKYFYQDIYQVILSDSFAVLRVGKQKLFIDMKDYLLIQDYIQCTKQQIVSKHERYKWWIVLVMIVAVVQLGCLELGYQVVLKRIGFEYIFDALEVTFVMSMIVLAILIVLICKIKLNRKNIMISFISGLILIIGTFIIGNTLTNDQTIYSLSPRFTSQLVLKQNKETGKLQDYHYTFLCFGKKSNEMSANKDLDIDTKWLTGDCNLVTYRDNDGQEKTYVATYGERGNGISYYNVIGSMYGNWQTFNRGDKNYTIDVENGSIIIHDQEQEIVFAPQEIEQNGTIAITLYKGSKAQYVIVLNEDCTLDENYLIQKNGHITIVSLDDKTPVELFCTTYKEDSQVQANIDNEMREEAVRLVEKMQQIIQEDPTLENFESTQSIFKVKTTSQDYFEIAKDAYITEQNLYNDGSFKEDGQIQKITVTAGSIQDFFVGLDVSIYIENVSTGESETSGLIPDYRIMKADGAYLAARISYRVPGNVGLASLSTPLVKDVSQDKDYHYKK